jgi:hypothetical protein
MQLWNPKLWPTKLLNNVTYRWKNCSPEIPNCGLQNSLIMLLTGERIAALKSQTVAYKTPYNVTYRWKKCSFEIPNCGLQNPLIILLPVKEMQFWNPKLWPTELLNNITYRYKKCSSEISICGLQNSLIMLLTGDIIYQWKKCNSKNRKMWLTLHELKLLLLLLGRKWLYEHHVKCKGWPYNVVCVSPVEMCIQ